MRHADVCACRDCGCARLGSLMEGMPDDEGRATVAFAALKLSIEPFDVQNVALPYTEVGKIAEQIGDKLDVLFEQYPGEREVAALDDINTLLTGLISAWRRDP